MTPPSRVRSAPHGRAADRDTEERILDAAHAVFVRRGTAGARMQEIAREARVNAALLHYYFKTKERLAEAVFRRAAGRLFPAVIQVLASELELEQKVARVVQIELDTLFSAPYLPAYLIGELAHHPSRVRQLVPAIGGGAPEGLSGVHRTLRRQIAERVRAGTMRPMETDEFIINLIALCVFPFAARPLIMVLLDLDQKGFDALIHRRRSQIPGFFLSALRP